MDSETHFAVVGISHKTSDVALRERFAVPNARCAETLLHFAALPGVRGVVLLSTCNRVEYYFSFSSNVRRAVIGRLFQNVECPAAMDGAVYEYAGIDALRHLYEVAAGLDSMVLGETEILGQVKAAYQFAVETGTADTLLHRNFQQALRVAKEVRTTTHITRGPASVGAAAALMAEKVFGSLGHCHVAILGAGQIAEQTARTLASRGVQSLIVANRSHERAAILAAEVGAETIRLPEWRARLAETDIIISSTSAPHFVVSFDQLAPVMAQRTRGPLFIIDLAVPRDVDPRVATLDGIHLYDIDSLHAITDKAITARATEVAAASAIIEKYLPFLSEART